MSDERKREREHEHDAGDDARAELAAIAAQVAALRGSGSSIPARSELRACPTSRDLPRPPAKVTRVSPRRVTAWGATVRSMTPLRSPANMPPTMLSAMTLESLPVLAETVRGCTRCALSRSRTNTVFERGNPEAKLAFVGEAPGADEDAQGAPFVGRAGQLLDKMITAMGLSPERDVYICNLIKCRPPENRRPTPEETATCIPYLHQQLAAVRPRVIVALGNTSVQALLGTTLGITKLRGQFKMYKSGDTSSLVMPTYHPSYLLRPSAQQLEAKRQAWEDLQLVMKELGLKLPARR